MNQEEKGIENKKDNSYEDETSEKKNKNRKSHVIWNP
jgi:hypothetical protein